MTGNGAHANKRPSVLSRFILFRLTVTSVVLVLVGVGAMFLAPRLEAVYKDMKVELPGLSVRVFDAVRAARARPLGALAAAVAALAAVVVVPLVLPRPLRYVLTIGFFIALLVAAAVAAGGIFWPYLTMLRSLTDSRGAA